MAASDKTLAVALILYCLVLAAAVTATPATSITDTSPYDLVDNSCYCHCMIDRCMAAAGATREECAPSCDSGCIKSGRPGRIDAYDFCGY